MDCWKHAGDHDLPGVHLPQPRPARRYFDPDGLSELADSIRAHGILQPLSVRRKGGGRYELIAGERRLRAAMICGLEQVPCLVLEVSRESSCLLSLIENLPAGGTWTSGRRPRRWSA